MTEPVLSFLEYKQLVEQAPILIWRSDTTGGCDYFNERWLEFTGRTLAEEIGDGWAVGVHPDDLAHCLTIYRHAFEQRNSFEMEYRLRRHDGEYRWIFDRGGPFLDASGQFAGFIGSCVDVTERVEAQQTMRRFHDAELRLLRGLLPICPACRRIRDDHGYWGRVESYLIGQVAPILSHNVCPECAKHLQSAPSPKLASPGVDGEPSRRLNA